MPNNPTAMFKQRIAAIIIIAAGYGWAGGHFIPSGAPFAAYIFQAVIILLLLLFSIAWASACIGKTMPQKRWPTNALSIFAGLTLVINIANIVHGSTSHSVDSYGSHNTPEDLVPICIIMAGDALWLATLLPFFNKSLPKG
jgi:hypothetical protein